MRVERTGDYYTATARAAGVLIICEANTHRDALRDAYVMVTERWLRDHHNRRKSQ